MQPILNLSLNKILDEDFLESLAKSADLYKIGSNSVLDPEEIRIGLKVVPRAVMSLLINALTPMPLNSSIELQLPFGKSAYLSANKNAADDYTGSVYSDNKLVYDFKNRSIPGLGIILLSTFELYELEDLKDPIKPTEDGEAKIQKLIDERMELHSLVTRVVDNRISEREALHKLMMTKLNEALKKECVDCGNDPVVGRSIVEAPKKKLDFKPEDMAKKEETPKKGSPLKGFLERKKKPKEHNVVMAKSEQVNCDSCGHTIFGENSGYSGCICMGENMNSKIWIRKCEDGIKVRFGKGWSTENIELLLETLRRSK
jgi:ribosomal protein S27E